MTSKWDPATYSVVDPLVRGLANEATDYGEAIQHAIDWRKKEIERLGREVEGLTVYARRLRGPDQETA